MSLPAHWRLPTGNDFLSLPNLRAADFQLPDLNVLSSRYRGLVEFRGAKGEALLAPFLSLGGRSADLKAYRSEARREDYWTPAFRALRAGEWELELRWVCPPRERGAFLEFSLRNLSRRPLDAELGLQGCWAALSLRINETLPLRLRRRAALYGGLMEKQILLEASGAAPEFALSLGSPEPLDILELEGEGRGARKLKKIGDCLQASEGEDQPLRFRLGRQARLAPGQVLRFGITLGAGLEPISAAATNVELKRRGLEALAAETSDWLKRRQRRCGDERLDELLNWNLFFNLFYATGITLDSEQFVSLTSRSPNYYVSAGYWDRDALLWSFPAVLLVDPPRARRILEYAFKVQGRNIGVHSRFLDGVVLEPGFELDELCAPILALAEYLRRTGDQGLLQEPEVRRFLRRFERELAARRHPEIELYSTLSGPDDDFEPLPYLAVDNAIAAKALLELAEIKGRLGRGQEAGPLRERAERLRQALRRHFAVPGPRGDVFAWAIDLKGQSRLYSSPPGCLQLLPHYGFCSKDDPLWRNTVAFLHSADYAFSYAKARYGELGCSHSPHPWTLSIANSLLSGRAEQARRLLKELEFDAGLACEAYGAEDGKPRSGEAFATCAGFLAWAIYRAFGRQAAPEATVQGRGPGVSQRRQDRPGRGGQAPFRPAFDKPSPPPAAAPPPARPSQVPAPEIQPRGSRLLKNGKRSTRGVEALVPSEPLRPLKSAAKSKPAPPAKRAAPGKARSRKKQ